MNSSGHKQTLMADDYKYLSAAKANNYWIICVWSDNGVNLVERWSSENYDRSSVIER